LLTAGRRKEHPRLHRLQSFGAFWLAFAVMELLVMNGAISRFQGHRLPGGLGHLHQLRSCSTIDPGGAEVLFLR
jgi:hypothetical protein